VDVVLIIAITVAVVAGVRYAFGISWAWSLVIVVTAAKILSSLGVGR